MGIVIFILFLHFTSLVGGRGRSMGGVIDGWMKARGCLFFSKENNRNFCNRNIEIVVIIGVRRSLYVVLK